MFKALLKTRLQAMFASFLVKGKKGQKSGGKGKIALMAVLFLYVGAVFCFMFGTMFYALLPAFAESGNTWAYFAYAGVLALGLMIIASVFTTKTQLYEAKDNDMLLAMPIKPSAILASRSVMLLCFNLLYSSLVIIPAAVVYAMQMPITPVGALAFVLVFAAMIFFAFAISGVLGWLLAKLTSRVKNKSLFAVVFFIAFFAVYMYFVSNAEEIIMALISNADAVTDALHSIPPLYWLGSAIANENIIHLVLILLVFLLPFAAIWFVLQRTFLKVATTKRGFAKRTYNIGKMKSGSAMSALVRRETGKLFGSTVYLLNGGLGPILSVIAAVGLVVIKVTGAFYIEPELLAVLSQYGGIAICMLATMSLISCASVSIEAKTIWIARSMPVTTKQILKSKLLCHFILAGGSSVLLAVALAFFLEAGVINAVMWVLTAVVFNAFMAVVGLAENLRHPVLNWTNEAYAVKQGVAVLFTMLIGFGSAFVFIIFSVIFSVIIGAAFATLIMCALFGGIAFLIYLWILNSGARRYEKL